MKKTLPFLALVLLGCAKHTIGADDPREDMDAGETMYDALASSDAMGCGMTHCSADLHQVLDCNGNVVVTCSAEQGCGAGGNCVSPCQSAQDNQSTIGCDFFAATPAPDATAASSCYAIVLANTWSSAIDVKVDYQGKSLDANSFGHRVMPNGNLMPLNNGKLDPGQIGVFFLSAKDSNRAFWTACPGAVGYSDDYTSVDGTGFGSAFHVTTSAPVAAYDVYPWGGAKSYITSASLLIPTSAWGTNYMAADGYLRTAGAGNPYVQVLASQDDTHVTILPAKAIVGGNGLAPAAQNQPQTYTLVKGQFAQFFQNEELAGSPIASDKPITLFGGASCADIPVQSGYCDSLHQQLVGISMLGSSYLGVRYRNRSMNKDESVPWRFVGVVDGTTLTYDPPQQGAPSTLAQGQLLEFSATGPFRVASQDDKHPFYASAHMTGCTQAPTANCDGDPDYVNLVPPDRWLSSYLFVADPTYKNTNLVFVRGKAKDGTFKDVTLDCAGTLAGWQPIGSSNYEYRRVDLVIGGVGQNTCNNGVHTAKSDAPFGLTVWGFDNSVSYAYPAGMGTFPINTVVVTPNPK